MGLLLAAASQAIYTMQIFLFHSPRDTVFYFFQDMAFLPLQVLIVTIVLDQILRSREKREKLRKMNVVISAFYNEVGAYAIKIMLAFNLNFQQLKAGLSINTDWTDADFKSAVKYVRNLEIDIDIRAGDIVLLKDMVLDKKNYMLGMFQNTNLLEHDTFTDMLWAVFHVVDELENRESFGMLPETDLNHLSGDIKRALQHLVIGWIYYMDHLRKEYPYLFSLALRNSPFIDRNSVVIE